MFANSINCLLYLKYSSNPKQLFQTEVEFVEIPAVWHLANTSKFWVNQVIRTQNGSQIHCSMDNPSSNGI